ncbi:MAG: hypothetical protein R3236_09770, partial [Phycisphaeraceae bacterium]|nr:hypothetical protein [Phycisphaeraceae bacterium]
MSEPTDKTNPDRKFLAKEALSDLVGLLRQDGYTVVGPVQVDGVILLRPIESAEELARGVRDEQEGGRYRLVEGDPQLYFEYVVGPDSPKRYFFPPEKKLFSLTVKGQEYHIDQREPEPPRLAFIGLRACELAAIGVQDRVFGLGEDQSPYRCEADHYYVRARQQALLIAVDCNRPAATCFCDSMDTGPAVTEGHDLALTELHEGFLVRAGTERGSALAEKLPTRKPTEAELELEEARHEVSRGLLKRQLETEGLKESIDR